MRVPCLARGFFCGCAFAGVMRPSEAACQEVHWLGPSQLWSASRLDTSAGGSGGLYRVGNLQSSAPNRQVRGALIGAVVLGTAMAVVGSQQCEANESCTGTTIGFGLIGATVGAVIGGILADLLPAGAEKRSTRQPEFLRHNRWIRPLGQS